MSNHSSLGFLPNRIRHMSLGQGEGGLRNQERGRKSPDYSSVRSSVKWNKDNLQTSSILECNSIKYSKRSQKGKHQSEDRNSFMLPKQKIEFGIKDYKVPKINYLELSKKLTTLPKAKRLNFAEEASRAK
mmetsp:Transcript_24441/g.27096  ORF Transcript_24441/g.27096 Transcript_24441/m.27096 type:complete len:130 (+) Transcript_24441:25-414(+)